MEHKGHMAWHQVYPCVYCGSFRMKREKAKGIFEAIMDKIIQIYKVTVMNGLRNPN